MDGRVKANGIAKKIPCLWYYLYNLRVVKHHGDLNTDPIKKKTTSDLINQSELYQDSCSTNIYLIGIAICM